MSEAGQIVVLPQLLAHLRAVAPGVRLRVNRVPDSNPSGALELGEVDMAIGHITTMTTGFHQRMLLKEHYVCIACRDNTRFAQGITLDAYRSAFHAIADSSGMAHWIVDRELELRGIKRQVGLVVPEFLALPFVIPGSELIATVPSRVADRLAQVLPIKVMALPIELAPYDVLMLWHERAHADAASQWLRQTLATLFESV
jgi:DNA-binding transcriptional LysR family regulator